MKIPGYSIQRQIGQGGMAMVYYAIQESLGRPVALKVMNPLLADRPEFSQRFLNEGRLLAALRHSNIITIYDIGASEQYHYISMEYVDGGDLRQRLTHGLTPLRTLDYVITLGHCLKAAHDLQIVHRDIKPVNILFRRDDTLLLTDFGVAKDLSAITELTATGSMVGSPYYISPEQALGRGLDGRADIYSLGIVFYEMLVGKRPFQGDSAIEVAMQHINTPLPPLPPELSLFQPVLQKMLAKDPQDRFPHAASLIAAVQEVRESHLQHDAGLTTSVHTLPGVAVPHAVGLAPAVRSETPEQSPLVANVVLEETIILPEPEESTTPGEMWISKPSGTDGIVHRLTPTKLWLLAGATSALAFAVVISAGSLTGLKNPSVPAHVVASSPGLPAHPVGAVPPVPPVDVAEPVLSLSALPAVESAQPTELVQALAPSPLTDAEPAVVRQDTDGEPLAEVAPAALSAPPETRTAQVEALLSAARDALADNRLTSPAEDNAASYYQQARALDPTHSQVAQGDRLIAERYYELATQSVHKGQHARTRQYVQSGLHFQDDHPGLLALQDGLQTSETQRQLPPPPPDEPPQQTTQTRSRSDASARRLRPSGNSSARSEPGVFSRPRGVFRTSPRGYQFPSEQPRSINE